MFLVLTLAESPISSYASMSAKNEACDWPEPVLSNSTCCIHKEPSLKMNLKVNKSKSEMTLWTRCDGHGGQGGHSGKVDIVTKGGMVDTGHGGHG